MEILYPFGLFQMRHISDEWSKFCILFFNFRILQISCEVPYFTPYLTALNVNCSSKFILSKYLLLLVSSSRHDFLLNEKKNHTTTKNTDQLQPYFTILHDESIFQEILYWQKTYFSLYKIFMSAPLPCNFFMILLPHDFNFWHLIIF